MEEQIMQAMRTQITLHKVLQSAFTARMVLRRRRMRVRVLHRLAVSLLEARVLRKEMTSHQEARTGCVVLGGGIVDLKEYVRNVVVT